jgi:TRAP-type C4-dicarboxylate transport system permease small subunit
MAETGNRPPILERVTRLVFTVSAVTLLPVITGVISGDAFLRYAFNAPTSWAQDTVGLLLFLLFAAALTHSIYGHFHVNMELIYDRLGPRLRLIVRVVSAVAAVLFSGLLAYQAIPSTLTAYRTSAATPMGGLPIWPFAAIASLCFVVFALAVVANILGAKPDRSE